MNISELAFVTLEQQRPFMEYLLTMLDEQFKEYDAAFQAEQGRAFMQKRLNEQRRDAAKVKVQFQTMARCLHVLGGRAPNPSPEYLAKHQSMCRILHLVATTDLETLGQMEGLITSPVDEAVFKELKALGSYERILKDLSRHCHGVFPKQEDGSPTAEFEAWYQALQAALGQVISVVENSLAEFASLQLEAWAKQAA